jgi:hypothetical protein
MVVDGYGVGDSHLDRHLPPKNPADWAVLKVARMFNGNEENPVALSVLVAPSSQHQGA